MSRDRACPRIDTGWAQSIVLSNFPKAQRGLRKNPPTPRGFCIADRIATVICPGKFNKKNISEVLDVYLFTLGFEILSLLSPLCQEMIESSHS